MIYKHLVYTCEQGIGRITLNRPERLNCLDAECMAELLRAVDAASNEEGLRVLVLAAEGRAFSAGQDLRDPSMQPVDGRAPELGRIIDRHFRPLVMRLQELPVPTLAAVNGAAVGGGAGLALACDLVVAARSAYFQFPFAKIGLSPDTGTTWQLARRIGITRALGLTLLGERLTADVAAQWGLIWEATEDQKFEERVAAMASQLAVSATRSLLRTRQLVQAAVSNTLDSQLRLESWSIAEMGRTADYREGVSSFLEKRAARFSGS